MKHSCAYQKPRPGDLAVARRGCLVLVQRNVEFRRAASKLKEVD